MIAILSRYSVETMRHVCDPRDGLPGKLKFLPTVAEIKSACEEHSQAVTRAVQRERDLREQLAAPRQIGDNRPRKSYEQIQTELAAEGIHIGNGRPQKVTDVSGMLSRYGVSQEQFDAIPDLPWSKSEGTI